MNLRPAPFFLTQGATAAVLDGRSGARLVHVPVLPVTLIDTPRRSEEPALARANDNSLLPPPGETIRSGVDGARAADSGNLPVPDPAAHTYDVEGG